MTGHSTGEVYSPYNKFNNTISNVPFIKFLFKFRDIQLYNFSFLSETYIYLNVSLSFSHIDVVLDSIFLLFPFLPFI